MPWKDVRHFPDYIFKHIFLNVNVYISILLAFIPNDPINNIPTIDG